MLENRHGLQEDAIILILLKEISAFLYCNLQIIGNNLEVWHHGEDQRLNKYYDRFGKLFW